jgi:alpha-glucosidase (family GH31 glycosyl hydrolase)
MWGCLLLLLLLLPHCLLHRWASAGAFYPFSRNHYTYFARPHEYYRWPEVAASAKKAYGLRYRLLTYIYSNLFLAHTHGGPLAKPLLFNDPADVKARWGSRGGVLRK